MTRRARDITKKRANEVWDLIRKNPGCTRKQLVSWLPWAVGRKDSVVAPIGFLERTKRVRSEGRYNIKYFVTGNPPTTEGPGWSEHLVSSGKIEQRTCGGTTQQGKPCKTPALYVTEDGFCGWHRPNVPPQRPTIQQGSDGTAVVTTDIAAVETEAEVEGTLHTSDDSWSVTARITEDEELILRVTGKATDGVSADAHEELRAVVEAFLNGEITTNDLRKAIE